MKYLTTIHNIENIESLLKEASGLVVGIKGFSTRETSLLTVEEFLKVSEITKIMDKELYISLKPMLYDAYSEGLKTLFKEIKDFYYTGVIVADIGYYYLLNELKVNNIIYNPETLLTNTIDFNNSIEIGIKGAFVGKEISVDDIIQIAKNKKGKVYLNAHGHLNMFYSHRKLLDSYFNHVNKDYNYENKTTLTLEEERRKGKYPIIEDEFGTHIYREKVSTVVKYLDSLEMIDYFLIDTIFKDDLYAIEVLKMFKEGYSLEKEEKIKNKYKEQWDNGFLDIKTIYKTNEKS